MTLPRPVTQFNVKTCIRPYETTFSGLLTIVLDEAISGEFEVAEFFRPMQVSNFHNSLQLFPLLHLYISLDEVRFQDTIANEGYCLHLYRVCPS